MRKLSPAWVTAALLLSGGSTGLAGCGPGASPGAKPTAKPAVRVAGAAAAAREPTVLATTQHYARLLTQAAPPALDSLLRYQALLAEPDLLPGRYLLRLRTHTVIVRPGSAGATIIIEPTDRARLSDSPATGPAADPSRTRAVVPSRVNPVLAVQLQELTAVFGPWQGDSYIPVEEPRAPALHPTQLRYRNPTTGQTCRLFVSLTNVPSAGANAVHEISLLRASTP